MRMPRTCAQWMLYRLVLLAWGAVLIAGAALAWKFISERGFRLPAIPGAMNCYENTMKTPCFGCMEVSRYRLRISPFAQVFGRIEPYFSGYYPRAFATCTSWPCSLFFDIHCCLLN